MDILRVMNRFYLWKTVNLNPRYNVSLYSVCYPFLQMRWHFTPPGKFKSVVAKNLQCGRLKRCRFSPLVGKIPWRREGIATYSSVLAWRIPWTEEPGGLRSIGSQRAGHDWVTNTLTWMVRFGPFLVFFFVLNCIHLKFLVKCYKESLWNESVYLQCSSSWSEISSFQSPHGHLCQLTQSIQVKAERVGYYQKPWKGEGLPSQMFKDMGAWGAWRWPHSTSLLLRVCSTHQQH